MTEDGINRIFILDGLREAVQALAAPGEVALALVPDGTVKADELALDFDNSGRAVLESLESELACTSCTTTSDACIRRCE
jgi:hypothetical protein